MSIEKGWYFGKRDGGEGRGFNDPGIDLFEDQYTLWREILQNAGWKIEEIVAEFRSKQSGLVETFSR